MKKIGLIIAREFLNKVRNKSFIFLTFFIPVIFVISLLISLFIARSNESRPQEILIVDNSQMDVSKEFYESKNVKFVNVTEIGFEMSKSLVKENKYDGLLYIPKAEHDLMQLSQSIQYLYQTKPSDLFIGYLESTISRSLKYLHLEKIGIDKKTINQAAYTTIVNQIDFSGNIQSKLTLKLKIILGVAGGYLILMFIVIYGNSVMRSVIEEKTSRIVELIISSVSPSYLLIGKIMGNAAAGLLQFLIWIILLLGVVFFISAFYELDILKLNALRFVSNTMGSEEMNYLSNIDAVLNALTDLPLVFMFFLWGFYFVGGFFLYSSIYAAIGAAVGSETDTQQFVLPINIPLYLSLFIGITSVLNNPHGSIATAFSILPLTSPIVMIMRIPFGVPSHEIFISIVMLLIAFLGIVYFAAKIYTIGLLKYGQKPSFKDIYRWMKN